MGKKRSRRSSYVSEKDDNQLEILEEKKVSSSSIKKLKNRITEPETKTSNNTKISLPSLAGDQSSISQNATKSDSPSPSQLTQTLESLRHNLELTIKSQTNKFMADLMTLFQGLVEEKDLEIYQLREYIQNKEQYHISLLQSNERLQASLNESHQKLDSQRLKQIKLIESEKLLQERIEKSEQLQVNFQTLNEQVETLQLQNNTLSNLIIYKDKKIKTLLKQLNSSQIPSSMNHIVSNTSTNIPLYNSIKNSSLITPPNSSTDSSCAAKWMKNNKECKMENHIFKITSKLSTNSHIFKLGSDLVIAQKKKKRNNMRDNKIKTKDIQRHRFNNRYIKKNVAGKE